jgi:hypothetical protein
LPLLSEPEIEVSVDAVGFIQSSAIPVTWSNLTTSLYDWSKVKSVAQVDSAVLPPDDIPIV